MADQTQKKNTTKSEESFSVEFKLDEQLPKLSLENGNDDSDDTASESLKRRPRGLQRNSQRDELGRRRTKSLYGVSPNCKFGPKGCILESREGCVLTIPDPRNQKLTWNKPPLTVLVVKKLFDDGALTAFLNLVQWLVKVKNMLVYCESSVLEDSILKVDDKFKEIQNKLQIFNGEKDDLTNKVDFIICLGGDGTLLYASSLFQMSVPPVMAFNLGSLGFLTPFHFNNFKEQVTGVLEGNASLLLRYRLKCIVSKRDGGSPSKTSIPTKVGARILVFNEVVIDRGQSSYLTNLDLYVEGRLVTTAQGDGIIISTPTGSTAYAMAAGASMVHPSVPAIVITPICPHSLSFRPIVVPAGVEIKVSVAPDSRNPASASFDGRDRQEITQGDSVIITTAQYPVPSVCFKDQMDDWFDSLAECLHWNVRKPQKPLASTPSVTSLDSMDLSN
ncbi:NAD kinase-like isoform X2 [Mizuhopecten yessoensis]|uniref:NAD kinase-like isoform X2 n=1 Tax=Mizuhopecten yessoensis TaxID=6573 RepID=UPI000B457D46|nr:NAD kinase-like isoform X2 [Mizuhopecten yessoensis]